MAKKKRAKKSHGSGRKRRFRFTPKQEEYILAEYPKVRGKKGEIGKLRQKFNRKFGVRVSVENFRAKCSGLWRSQKRKSLRKPVSIAVLKGENTEVILKVNGNEVWRGSESDVIEKVTIRAERV